MFTTQLTEEQRLSKAVVDIMQNDRYTALAGVLMIGDRGIKDDVPTAYTNGRDEYYGRAFVAELTDAELRFVVLHENYHKLYKHLITWRHLFDKHAQCANASADYVINHKIVHDNTDGFAVMPKHGLYDDKYADMNTAEVFNLLYEELEEDGQSGDGTDDGSGGSGSGSRASDPTDSGGFDTHDWEGAHELSPEEQQELAREIDEAVRQGALAAGKMGGTVDRDLQELLEPQVDWREALREFITSTCAGNDYSTWSRPNRRYVGAGVYMPSGISEKVGELVIAVDTSGSIGQYELTTFLSEVTSICETVKPDKIRLLYWGHIVAADESYELHELDTLIKSTKPMGGGGTDVTCVVEYMREHAIDPQAAVVLTDGYVFGGWGSWPCPVLWTIMDNKQCVPDCGKTLHIKGGELHG